MKYDYENLLVHLLYPSTDFTLGPLKGSATIGGFYSYQLHLLSRSAVVYLL